MATLGSTADPLLQGNDVLKGTAEHDEIYGQVGNDAVDGEGGDDHLDGESRADELRGGAGDDDAVGYDGVAGVRVSRDGRADDGAPGEADNAHPDTEDVYAGRGGDTLVGSRERNTLGAGDGADRLSGANGPDALFGAAGTDILDGRLTGSSATGAVSGDDVGSPFPVVVGRRPAVPNARRRLDRSQRSQSDSP